MRILVTGGAGFIGSHLVDAFLAQGHEVAVFDNLSTGTRENVADAAEFVDGDIRDRHAVSSIFEVFRPEVLVHQAAQVSVRSSVADPAADAETNIVGSINLFRACVEKGTHRVLFASTGGAIYGEQEQFPADELHATQPVSPYGVAKLAVEKYLYYFGIEHGLRWTALRYANVYGPRQSPHGEAGVVAIFSGNVARGVGSTINGDGLQTRDYVYVGDVVAANVATLESDLHGAYNVGTGVETTVIDIYEGVAKHADVRIEPAFGPAKPGEQRRSCLDAGRLARDAGWSARTTLDDGLAATYRSLAQQGASA